MNLNRRRALAFGLATLISLTGCRAALNEAREQRVHYLSTETFVLARVLPPPPANLSPQTRAELDEMLRIQGSRTAEQSERARADADASVFRFADAVGSDRFTPANLPLTTAFFKKIKDDEIWAAGSAKDAFERPRPFMLESTLQPLLAKPASASYPSGHSTWAFAVGLVLADMLPERRAAVMARAQEYANNRVVVGVHYPSDVEAGKMAGSALATALFASAAFRADCAAATRELRAALSLPALHRAPPR